MKRLSIILAAGILMGAVAFSAVIGSVNSAREAEEQSKRPCCIRGRCVFMTPFECGRNGGRTVRSCSQCR